MTRRTHVDVRVTGPLAPYVAGYRTCLAEQGYASYTVMEQLRLMAHASRWLAGRQLDGVDLTVARGEQFIRARREEGYARPVSLHGMLPLLDYLRTVGVVPVPEPAAAARPADVLIARYRHYLVEERGLASSSVRHYLDVASAFLVHRSVTGDVDLAGLAPADVTEFVLAVSRRHKSGYAKSIATRLRSLLRFVHAEGLTSYALAAAVPSVASWRLTSLPKAINTPDVARLLRSCDRRTTVGRRDFAILTVLTRLGLRAGEVAALRLEDIDWRKGEVTVHGKGSREDRLPLPQDVGEAVAGWLRRGRPQCVCPAVFTRVLAPHSALSSGGVSNVVRQACGRADLPSAGAHRLRHYVATEILRTGGNLVEVGQVLRHRSPTTTSIYAKVDRLALSAVVQPWPGSAA